jgi:hypothetical protein
MPTVFISYRRDDSEGVSGRLSDRLKAHFGQGSVFLDIDSIPSGVDFRQHLDQALSQCDVLLVVIGERWLHARHSDGPRQGQRRLYDPTDFVRLEVQSALERGIAIIPVLVGKGAMPNEQELPDDLKGLACLQAAEVRARDFDLHVDRLIRDIERLLQGRRGTAAVPPSPELKKSGPQLPAATEGTRRVGPLSSSGGGWKFWKPPAGKETRRRRATLDAIDRWWQEFQTKTGELDDFFHGRKRWDLPGWMNQHLGTIAPNLMWEFGPGPGGGHQLTITPEGERHLRPLVETVLERAPQVQGWSFAAYRPPEPLDVAYQSVMAKGGGDLAATTVRAAVGKHHRIDLSFRSPLYEAADEPDACRDVFWMTESLLGEEVLDRWVGIIETAPAEEGERLLPLERLHDTVKSVIQSIVDQLPDRPCYQWREEALWTQFGVKPQKSEDYVGQTDLIVAGSMLPDMWMSAHTGRSFFSGRFSRCGETFCYVKIEGSQRPKGGEVDYRSAIEDALNEALVPAQFGCSVGGGTGLRYSYIDLALTNVEQAQEVIRRVLQERKIPKRSWLLFYDRDWEQEWIGVWDDSPPPPLPE